MVAGELILFNSIAAFWYIGVVELLNLLFVVDGLYNRAKV